MEGVVFMRVSNELMEKVAAFVADKQPVLCYATEYASGCIFGCSGECTGCSGSCESSCRAHCADDCESTCSALHADSPQ